MRCLPFIFAIGLIGLSSLTGAQAPENPLTPDPREIPLPPIATRTRPMPGVAELPARAAMPDVMVMNDGTRVSSRRQWQERRKEMRGILSHYAVGEMPPAPGNMKGRDVHSELVLDGTVRYRLIRLTFGPKEQLTLDIGIYTPVKGGPFPAVILPGGIPPGGTVLPRLPQGPNQGRGENVLLTVGPVPPPASVPNPGGGGTGSAIPRTAASLATQRADVLRRGYALVVFNPNDCAEDTTLRNLDGSWAFRNTRFFPAYPGYDWGILAGWAWGASRVADYLETDASIDKGKLIITGASRNGKAAMIAAAFDDRLMGAPAITGGGGIGAYRFAGPRGSETLDLMELKYPNWFAPNLRQFRGQREKLPFDQHWFLALAAPRPFIALEGDTDRISLPEAVKQSILGARPAYALFGATDRLGVNYAHHAHSFTGEDWTAMLDFFDVHLRGRRISRRFDRFPTDAELDAAAASAHSLPAPATIDARVREAMAETRANGMAIAVIDDGRVNYVQAYGARNAKGEPLQTDTVMYGASITKTVMAYTALTLVDQGKLDLDAPLAGYLERPLISYGEGQPHLAKYGPYRDLAGDERWRRLTARMALTHSTGFHNFWFIEPDRKLRIHFEPGSRYSYSGEGFSLLQFTIEHGDKANGLGLDIGEYTNGIFARLGMTRTALKWRPEFGANLADGWNDRGEAVPHDERSNVRVAGSMDTTISDLATFIAALVRGEGLSASSRADMTKPWLHIGTAHQFPNFAPDLPKADQRPDLAAGLGVIVFDGPQGRGFYKGGHDGQTANSFVCLERGRRCVLLLANDVRAEARFADLVRVVLGETGVPYDWEYGDRAGKS